MNTATYLATQNNPASDLIVNYVDDYTEPMMPATDIHGRVTKGSAIGYLPAYAVIAGFFVYLFAIV